MMYEPIKLVKIGLSSQLASSTWYYRFIPTEARVWYLTLRDLAATGTRYLTKDELEFIHRTVIVSLPDYVLTAKAIIKLHDILNRLAREQPEVYAQVRDLSRLYDRVDRMVHKPFEPLIKRR